MISFLKKHFSHQKLNRLLYLLLAIDVLFIIAHIIVGVLYAQGHIDSYDEHENWLVTKDHSFSEFFQYFKYALVVVTLIIVMRRYEATSFISWVILFLFFIADDALTFHERAGDRLEVELGLQPAFGLRAEDFGELLYTGGLGIIILGGLIFAYWKGTTAYRKTSIDLILMVGLLLFFGVVVDMLHIILGGDPLLKFILGLIEDGCEMLVMSGIVWYAFFLKEHYLHRRAFLYQGLKSSSTA